MSLAALPTGEHSLLGASAMDVEEAKKEKITLVSSPEELVVSKSEETGVRKGMQIDEFSIESLIGRGGASEVYRAHDTRTDSVVALKFLLPSRFRDEQSSARLRSEAKHIMALRHRCIVSVLDVRESDAVGPYLVMELIDGKPLTEYLPLAEKVALEVCAQVAEALSYAHTKGMIHRDIKPSNVMMLNDGTIRLVDFGLAKVFDKENPEHMPLTRTKEIVGTPLYMSPEQCFGQDLSATSDIYQLGCLLFQSITGFPPFEGSTSFEAMYKHVSAQADLSALSPPIQNILRKAMDKNPAARFQSAYEMGQCLRDAKDGRSKLRRKKKPNLLVATLAVVTLLGGVWLAAAQFKAPSTVLGANQLLAQQFYEQGVEYKARGWTALSREALTKAINLDKGEIGFKALSFLRAKLPAHEQPQDAEQMNILGYNFDHSQRKSEAEKVWTECISKYPNFEWPYCNLATIYLNKGQNEKALQLLEKALEINPYYTNALSNMSYLQSQLGHRDLAIKYMKLAADSAPEDPGYGQALSQLQRH